MDKLCGPSPLCKEVQGSSSGKLQIPFPRYENELVPKWDLQFGVLRKKGHNLK